MTDNELVIAAKNGDKKAFRDIVHKFQGRIASTVIGMLGKTAEAEDVGQETFIRFYKSMENFRGEANIGTYLTRIAINLSLNEIKKRKRIFSLFSNYQEEETLNSVNSLSKDEGEEDKKMVQQAILQLKPDYRSVVVLRLIDGYSSQETADILKIPLGTVLSRLARAQKKLKNVLIKQMGVEYAE
ncbi:MAG: RNA polymerase sigma factor [Fibrobacteria bacterium]|nr:RNA polymerase sigma factor [Fibrobacteria bacterium]